MPVSNEIVTSRANARVKQLRAAFAGQARLSAGLIGIEGEHLVTEALRSGMVLKTVFLSERVAPPRWLPFGIETIRLAQDVFQSAVETQTPQGIAALLVPPVASVAAMLQGTPLLLIGAGLQDPGNLGTLVRSAEAFGATGLLTSAGSASPWNGKAVRASAGSVFRVPTAVATEEVLEQVRAAGVTMLAAVKDGALAVDSEQVAAVLAGACALVIGNEGAGLSEEWLARCELRVTIPCPGPVESLNAAVAGSVLLYEASRCRRRVMR